MTLTELMLESQTVTSEWKGVSQSVILYFYQIYFLLIFIRYFIVARNLSPNRIGQHCPIYSILSVYFHLHNKGKTSNCHVLIEWPLTYSTHNLPSAMTKVRK